MLAETPRSRSARARRYASKPNANSPPRLELQLGAEDRLDAPVPRAAVADAQHLRDRLRIIGLRRVDGRGGEQRAAAGLDLLFEGGEHACAPIARGRHNDTLAMAVPQ